MRWLFFALMTLLAFAAPAAAQLAPGERHLDIALVAESDAPTPGSRVMLALSTVPRQGWHGYWINPGDAGLPARFRWTLPAGASVGAFAWPLPEPLLIAGLMNYAYPRPYAPLAELTVPAGLAVGVPLPVRLHADYLVCSESLCVPESADLALDLTVGDGRIAPERRARFDAWRAALPKPLGAAASYAREKDGALTLAVPYPAAAPLDRAYFFPTTQDAIDYAAPQTVTRDGDRLLVATRGKGAGRIEGVLRVGEARGLSLTAMPGAVAPAASRWAAALIAFAGAVLGGLILNVMPCVFPILSLKALGLARSGERAAARREALGYAAGAISVCVTLGVAILVLRAGGSAAGWAFQLQDPRASYALLLLSVVIALNLAGLFELPVPRFAQGGSGISAFATGALAAFVATPCTGPFMGAALGAALVLPAPAAVAVFAGLGLGLALPFLVLGFVPALQRRLPRPGPWMARLQRALSLPMWLTALALVWVLGRQAGVDALTLALGGALLLGLALWLVGGRPERRWWLAPALAGALAIGLAITPAPARPAASVEAFSEVRLAALRAGRRPVFAYFTADWCLTCKVNERAAIHTRAVEAAFARRHVAVLEGDWTNGDAALGRFLATHGRAGVPLYLYYPAGEGEPRVLPQLLSRDMLVRLADAPG